MKKISKSLLFSILILLVCFINNPVSAKSRKEAVAWAESKLGQYLDYDGVYGAQCVDLIKYYYAEFFGIPAVSGNGCDYATNSLPAGWQRIKNYTELVPEPGDIAIWANNGANHVAIVTSATMYQLNTIDQNLDTPQYPPGTPCPCIRATHTYGGGFWGIIKPSFTPDDTTPPSITNVKISNVNSKGYDISCTATDNVGVVDVRFPTWTSNNGQDDLANPWPRGTQNGNTWSYHVNVAEHKNESGAYITHIYAYDAAGNNVCVDGVVTDVPKPDNEKPKITDVKVTNLTSDGYTVSCKATDNVEVIRVEFPTWTSNNGQDDLQNPWPQGSKSGETYTFNIKISDHKNERGEYITHIYAFDAAGNSTVYHVDSTTVPEPEPEKPLKMSLVQLTNQTYKDFTVEVRVECISPTLTMKRVYFEVVKDINGESVLKDFDATNVSGNLYRATIPVSEFNNTSGSYSVKADVTLSNGVEYESVDPLIVNIEKEPEEDSFKLTISSDPEDGGSVSGEGNYKKGSSVSVKAVPNNGYKFVGWFNGNLKVSSQAEYSFYISSDTFLVAKFEKEKEINPDPSPSNLIDIYRLYNSSSGEHLYTFAQEEVKALTGSGWNYEGIGWNAPETGTPVYRLYNPIISDHLYTTDENEVQVLTSSQGWTLDFGGEPIFYSGGVVPIYRLYNPGNGRHHLTKDTFEYSILPDQGWIQEGLKLKCIS